MRGRLPSLFHLDMKHILLPTRTTRWIMSKSMEASGKAEMPGSLHATNQQNAAEGIVDALIREKVKAVFGMTGDTVLPLLDALYARKSEIRYVTTKFETSTVAMA